MNLLCTNSDIEEHMDPFAPIAKKFEILYLDQPYDLLIASSEFQVSQNGRTFRLQEGDRVVFFLFRAPLERPADLADPVGCIESLQLLKEACSIVGVIEHNRIEKWERAYSKSALIRLAKRFPGLVPPVVVLDGTYCETVRKRDVDRIVKSGYGIRRPVEGLYPKASLIPANEEFTASRRYRYVIQDYVNPERELRVYVTRRAGRYEVTIINTPVASGDCPDWRENTQMEDLVCFPVEDSGLRDRSVQLCAELDLEYVCFDFLQKGEDTYLVDVNPHGSWEWLPANCRSGINDQVQSWLLSLA